MGISLLLGLCFAVSAQVTGAPVQPDPQLIRVHVQTDDGGIGEDRDARRASVAHLSAAIAEQKKGKVMVVVADEATADVIVEVMGRTVEVPKVVIGLGSIGTQPGRRAPVAQARTIKLEVTLRRANSDSAVEVTNKNRAIDAEPGWKSAAEDVAKQVEKWVAEHRTAILAARR